MTNHSYHFKVTNLSVFAVDLGFLVEEYAGSKGAIPPRKRRKKRTLYIATIEKAHSLVNSLIQDQRIANVGLVVVDEVCCHHQRICQIMQSLLSLVQGCHQLNLIAGKVNGEMALN